MTGFSLDFEKTFDGGDIQDGTYEVIITQAIENANKNGTEFVDMRLTIRNDIDQKHKNQIVFEKLWKANATGKYNMTMFNTIGKAAQLQKGKTYNSLEDLLKDFLNRPLRVTVKNETSEYNGKTYENLRVKRWEETKYPTVQHQFKAKENMTVSEMQSSGVNIDESDLPF